jgi:hypothetical protein
VPDGLPLAVLLPSMPLLLLCAAAADDDGSLTARSAAFPRGGATGHRSGCQCGGPGLFVPMVMSLTERGLRHVVHALSLCAPSTSSPAVCGVLQRSHLTLTCNRWSLP